MKFNLSISASIQYKTMDPDQVEYFREGIKKAKNGTAKATDIGD